MSHPTGTVGRVISIGSFFGIAVVQLPVLVALIVGLVLLAGPGRQLPPRSRLLARFGLILLLVERLVALAWSAFVPQLLAQLDLDGGVVHTYAIASALVGFLLALLAAAGIGLLVAALLAARAFSPPGGL
jgi:hypothetical protein